MVEYTFHRPIPSNYSFSSKRNRFIEDPIRAQYEIHRVKRARRLVGKAEILRLGLCAAEGRRATAQVIHFGDVKDLPTTSWTPYSSSSNDRFSPVTAYYSFRSRIDNYVLGYRKLGKNHASFYGGLMNRTRVGQLT